MTNILTKVCIKCKKNLEINLFNHQKGYTLKTCLYCRLALKDKYNGQKAELKKNKKEIQSKCPPDKLLCSKLSCNKYQNKDNFIGLDGRQFKQCKNCRVKYSKSKANTTAKLEKILLTKSVNKKLCRRCNTIKDITAFKKYKKRISLKCIQCLEKQEKIFQINDSRSNYTKKLREYYISKKKELGPCIDCGIKDFRVLTFDHVIGIKKGNVCKSGSINSMNIEIEKCVIRCTICHAKKDIKYKTTNRIILRNREYVNNVKSEIGGCEKCGWFEDSMYQCLEFDHINREDKLMNISEMCLRRFSLGKIQKEIEKCQLLCGNCHKIKTLNELKHYLKVHI
jgi:hypothetical protein